MGKVLIIDDENQLRGLLARIIGLEGYEVIQADSCKAGLKQVEQQNPDVIICDVRLPDGSGVDLITEMKRLGPLTEIILLTAHGNIPDGVQAIKNGAFDYITKGDDNNKIIPLLSRAMEKVEMARRLQQLEKQVGQKYSFESILGKSKPIRMAVELARKVSVTDVPVLLTGETGTGKEVFAQAIHQHSSRAGKAFVAVNCSAFSKELLESEIFGHKAGAFTGALKEKKGLFEEADQGTIFLDEIGELPLAMQSKLLTFLEDRRFKRVGGLRDIEVNVRIIAATNRDLEEEVEKGTFREDLFYRLNVMQIRIPPLRERREDIPVLARFYLEHFNRKFNKHLKDIDPAFLKEMEGYYWKGNVRELRNVMERCVLFSRGELLTGEETGLEPRREERKGDSGLSYPMKDLKQGSIDLKKEVDAFERTYIDRAMELAGGNSSRAAQLLGCTRFTLKRRLEQGNESAKENNVQK